MYYIITFTWRWYFSENLREKKEEKCWMLCLIYLKLFPRIKPLEKRSMLFWGGGCLFGTTFAEVH